MVDFDNGNVDKKDSNGPISFEENKPAAAKPGISHSPLNLGGTAPAQPKPQQPKPQTHIQHSEDEPSAMRKVAKAVSSSPDRISGVRTFFTKLHIGAVEFMDEQITDWLKDNPGVVIKKTNVVTGELAGKKTEPNIIISVWY